MFAAAVKGIAVRPPPKAKEATVPEAVEAVPAEEPIPAPAEEEGDFAPTSPQFSDADLEAIANDIQLPAPSSPVPAATSTVLATVAPPAELPEEAAPPAFLLLNESPLAIADSSTPEVGLTAEATMESHTREVTGAFTPSSTNTTALLTELVNQS